MKILYLSCHTVLEMDEISLFNEMGHEVFSPGAYVCPENPGDSTMRPGIMNLKYNPDIVNQYHRIGAANPGKDGKDHLTKEFVDNFDAVIVMHIPRWIQNNWDAIKHKTVIWRTIGQSVASTEQSLQVYRKHGLKIVRYSPQEMYIPGFIGQDALIRFYKDPQEFKDWNGNNKRVINFTQSMKQRGLACGYQHFLDATAPFPRALFGPGNNEPNFGMGKVPFNRLKQEMRDNRVYFYTGTHPASYTLNFIEAAMTGIPMVCLGPQLGNAEVWRNHNLYEVHQLVENGKNGFVSDSIPELRSYIRQLMNNDALAKKISDAGRKEAIRHFGKDMIMASWMHFFDKVL